MHGWQWLVRAQRVKALDKPDELSSIPGDTGMAVKKPIMVQLSSPLHTWGRYTYLLIRHIKFLKYLLSYIPVVFPLLSFPPSIVQGRVCLCLAVLKLAL